MMTVRILLVFFVQFNWNLHLQVLHTNDHLNQEELTSLLLLTTQIK
jgi:hypothetical protein